eukprot:10561155-Lingulodinium_polyedra.AAC.1
MKLTRMNGIVDVGVGRATSGTTAATLLASSSQNTRAQRRQEGARRAGNPPPRGAIRVITDRSNG